jgi:hypothetical protein
MSCHLMCSDPAQSVFVADVVGRHVCVDLIDPRQCALISSQCQRICHLSSDDSRHAWLVTVGLTCEEIVADCLLIHIRHLSGRKHTQKKRERLYTLNQFEMRVAKCGEHRCRTVMVFGLRPPHEAPEWLPEAALIIPKLFEQAPNQFHPWRQLRNDERKYAESATTCESGTIGKKSYYCRNKL